MIRRPATINSGVKLFSACLFKVKAPPHTADKIINKIQFIVYILILSYPSLWTYVCQKLIFLNLYMKILSINISEPKKIVFNNKELVSSIYKKPVDGEVEITENGIIGDKQADLSVHGGFEKAVYAYSYSHYKSWSEQMGEDYSNDYGLVGENLTIDDFDEKNLYIGDEVTISNCILKITQPRIPCFKLGIKMNDRKFPQLFSQSGNVGAYMKVLTPGKISKGDEIIITRQESSSMTVYEIMYLLYKDIQNTDQMKRALKISSLTEDIKEKFRERLLKLGDYSSL
ncbi:MAG: hypothetical protein CMD49_04550 [Gammaproteobacteria bacterium]|nr:hypothetical protein [Gammaproteobacteria bacterium]